jgi:hypothetical protein
MNTRAIRIMITIAATLSTTLLVGCLSKDETETAAKLAPEEGQVQNSPPSISGNPSAAVTIGASYSFTPTANDPDGDALSFSIQNRPPWASFDAATGALSGTPTLADIGVYGNISISVSDGSLNASLPQFSVDAVQTALGSVTLSWTAPTQNEDGSALVDLAGYKIHYGTASGRYTNLIQIDSVGMATYVVENLTPDTYFFAASAINRAGVESRYSNESMKVVSTM